MMVKDEADVIEAVLRHIAAQGVDGIIVADNDSDDATALILDELVGELPLHWQHDPDPAYYQSAKMTAMANQAHSYGATWVWPCDADELWTHGSVPLAVAVERDDVDVIHVPLWHHYTTALDDVTGNPFRDMVYRDRDPARLGKVIVRWQPG